MPTDSEFILAQGRMAQETRRRRMSDASVPSAMSTTSTHSNPLYDQYPGRAHERRRNTLGSTMFQTPPPPSSAGMFLPTPARPSTSPHPAMTCAVNNLTATDTSPLPLQTAACKDSPHVLFLMPLTPPQSPAAARSLTSMQPSCQQQRRTNATVMPPLATIPERLSVVNEEAFIDKSIHRSPPLAFNVLTAAAESCEDMENSRHIVLGSKKIRLARPRLVQILPSGNK
ncbi:hypothetical protein GGH94_001550 [Coemansia aciculifera]|uniref:Uncharacterized protein n=1 Tax=Coemansia aciculifera TaxID=417176 RepID=A0A9W8M4V5_9FUNG|nr:hypothetical protein GGH94_001550 [Coemansia aciculifera]KAJ2875825.1 hypothetical protein GGH93_001283 [Coemansia aciculifera]